MKKILACFSILMSFTLAQAAIGDRWTITDDGGSDIIRITNDGVMTPAKSTVDLGNSSFGFSEINVSSYTKPIVVSEYFSDIVTASTFSVYTTGGAGISTATATRYFGTASLTQPGEARNVQCTAKFDTGLSTQSATITWVVAGVNSLGDSVTETLTSTAPMTVVGNWAYTYISSISFTMTGLSETSNANICLDMGTGNKLGLAGKIVSTSDVFGVKEATVLKSVGSETISTTYNTIDFITDGNGSNDYKVWYKIRKAP